MTDADSNQSPEEIILAFAICVIGAFLFISVAGLIFNSAQNNNQFVRPFPNARPAPVVPQLPSLVAELSSAKSRCESRAMAAKSLLTRQPRRFAQLRRGELLYGEAKASTDYCISYLRTAVSRRFVDSDVDSISSSMLAAQRKVDDFVHWANSLEQPTYGASVPLDTMAEMLQAFMDSIVRQNAEAIEQVRADLEQCRLQSWKALGM